MRYIHPTFEEMASSCLKLYWEVKNSGYIPQLLVGVSSGGYFVLKKFIDIGRAQGIEHDELVIRARSYTGINKSRHVVIEVPDKGRKIRDKDILIVDEVVDTGESLKEAMCVCAEIGATKIKSASLYYKPHSIVRPDHYSEETGEWIIFPWERLETQRKIIEKCLKETLTPRDIAIELKDKAGFSRGEFQDLQELIMKNEEDTDMRQITDEIAKFW